MAVRPLIFVAAWWQRDRAVLAGRERTRPVGNDITGRPRSTPRATLVALAAEETRRNAPTDLTRVTGQREEKNTSSGTMCEFWHSIWFFRQLGLEGSSTALPIYSSLTITAWAILVRHASAPGPVYRGE